MTEDFWFACPSTESSLTAFVIPKDNIEDCRKALDKYYEWESIAVKNGKTLQKNIPDVGFKSSDFISLYGQNFSVPVDIYFTFFSQNTKVHQFVIRGKKKMADMDDYYFTKAQADKFYEAISESKLRDFKEKLKAQSAADDAMFN